MTFRKIDYCFGRLRPWITKLPALLLILTSLLGCSRSRPEAIKVPPGAKAGDFKLTACTFETMKYGRYDGERGILIVPENRAKSDSRLIALPIVRIHSRSAHPAEPIFNLDGGPGSSNIHTAVYRDEIGLLATRDYVSVGYRGVDGSVVLNCPEFAKALKGKGPDLLGAESLANLARAMRIDAARLEAEGVDLLGYSVPEVAEDLEAARRAFGYDRVNLISESYGTRVAMIYAHLHPDRVKRSLMVGVNPPGHFVWDPKVIDTQIERYAQLWAQNPECRKRCPDLAGAIRRVAHHMPRRWLVFPIDPGKVRVVTFSMLYGRESAAMIFDAYVAADQGDPSGLALISMMSDFVLPKSMVWGEAFAKGVIDYDPARNYVKELDPPGSILGSPLALLLWGPTTGSWPWPVPAVAEELHRVQPSDVETLLVSGNLDFSTPAEAATKELLPLLSHGKQIVLSEMGHCNDLEGNQPAAFQKVMLDFYDTGKVDEAAFAYAPMDFKVEGGLPKMAKMYLAKGLGIILLLVLGSWLLFKLFRLFKRWRAKSRRFK